MAFPSYYREGVPKSLIEASAIGRPIITCNSVGCKDVVEDGVNGFLIEPQNVQQLATRLKQLIEDKALREQMGRMSREIAERDFSIEKVIDVHMELYRKDSIYRGFIILYSRCSNFAYHFFADSQKDIKAVGDFQE